MNGNGEEEAVYEIAVVVSRSNVIEEKKNDDVVDILVAEFRNVGLIVDKISGVSDEFIKVAAPPATLGRAAAETQMKKPTHIGDYYLASPDFVGFLLYFLFFYFLTPFILLNGMDLQFEWEEVDAFVKQPDGSLFRWPERFQCYHHLIYGIVNKSNSVKFATWDGKELRWEVGKSLMHMLESEGIVKQVFPLHDELRRKKLLKNWALNWRDLTDQPIDEIYSYFGTKVAIYFAFLGKYTNWLFFPAALGLIVQLVDFGSLQWLALPVFFISITLWAMLYFQFWKRKNYALLARWQINCTVGIGQGHKLLGMEWSSLQSPVEVLKNLGIDKRKEKELYQRHEWLGYLMRIRNDVFVILSIICLQLPLELAYAHLYEVIGSKIIRFGLTAIYLCVIQYFTQIGGKISVKLIKKEKNENSEYQADSLVYKVFGLYFMQTYIGIFYHALLHRNFMTLRQVLIQRLIIAEVLDNLLETTLPYLKYKYKKYKTIRNVKKREKLKPSGKTHVPNTRVEKEYLKPAYSASIGEDLQDGLFDDFLELALQFGMIMMFACAFPLAFAFAAVNNIMEIRSDALKLLSMLKRPVPRDSVTIGAWINIFQFLIVMSICTNSALLVWFYDQERNWSIEPGLAAILIMEHVLLLIKFGFSHYVPEEPAWVRANRVRNASQAQDVCSKQLLRAIFGEKTSNHSKKNQ